MKKIILLMVIVLFAAACGSSVPDNAGVTSSVEIDWPTQLTVFEKAAYKLYGSVTTEDGVTISDSNGEFFEGKYYFDFGWISDGDYLFQMSVKYSSGEAEVPVATAEKTVELVDGGNSFELGPDDFTDIGGGDIDGDSISNLVELQMGLDPFLIDTDSDDIPDDLDVFPSMSSEWLDTDGDGLGDNSDGDIDGDGLDNDTEDGLGTNIYNSDTDGDNVIDTTDNCRLKPNANQADVDGDGSGDACDDDKDGDGLTDAEETLYGTNATDADSDDDGLSDLLEITAKTNPLKEDTDGDRYGDKVDAFPLNATEWFDADKDLVGDNTDNCKFTPNNDQVNTDKRLSLEGRLANPDSCGDACEHECDNDIDGDGFHYVYVDTAGGDDDNLGIFSEPVATIVRGILLAHERNEDAILVAGGVYDLNDAIFQLGIDLYGGYDGSTFINHSNSRNIRSEDPPYLTILENSESSTTLNLGSDVGAIIVEGFQIENDNESSQSTIVKLANSESTIRGNKIISNGEAEASQGIHISGGSPVIDANWFERSYGDVGRESEGIYAENASPVIKNNIIKAGGSRHAVGIEVRGSNAIIANNTIDGSSSVDVPGTSTGLLFRDSNPTVANNIIVAAAGDSSDAVAVKCIGISPEEGELTNNILSTFTEGSSDALAMDCNRKPYYDANITIGGMSVDDNLAHSGAFVDLLNADYALASADIGVNKGIDTDDEKYGRVVTDYNMAARTLGAYDIGAKEKN